MKDLRDEARPTRGRAALLGGLLFNPALSRLLHGAISAHSIGIVAVEECAVFPRVRDVIRHSRQPFQRIESVFDRGGAWAIGPHSQPSLQPAGGDGLSRRTCGDADEEIHSGAHHRQRAYGIRLCGDRRWLGGPARSRPRGELCAAHRPATPHPHKDFAIRPASPADPRSVGCACRRERSRRG